MVVGIDFDNTLVCYDEVFQRAALERGLIPPSVRARKDDVRDYLRGQGTEEAWTQLQGEVYGVTIRHAPAFSGALQFLDDCRASGVEVCVISHKTAVPVLGEPHDLHRAAHEWLEMGGFYDTARTGLSRARVFLESTKQAKLARIRTAGCTHFVDDLPEFLLEPEFPEGVRRVLFDPAQVHAHVSGIDRVDSWSAVGGLLLRTRLASH